MQNFPLSKKITFMMTVVGFTLVLFGLLLYLNDGSKGLPHMDIGAALLALSMIIDLTGLRDWLDEL